MPCGRCRELRATLVLAFMISFSMAVLFLNVHGSAAPGLPSDISIEGASEDVKALHGNGL